MTSCVIHLNGGHDAKDILSLLIESVFIDAAPFSCGSAGKNYESVP
jgi:hypothetical protein